MAWVDDDGDLDTAPNVYAELLELEEKLYARRGGRLVLVGNDHVARQMQPPPLLVTLRAGEPVEVEDWRVPSWARPDGGRVRNVRLRIYPSGKIEYAR